MAHTRLAGSRCFAENLAADGHITPAEHTEAFLGHNLFNDCFLVPTLFLVFREKYKTNTIIALSRNFEARFFFADLLEKVVRKLDKDASTIPSDWIATTATTVIEIHANLECALNDTVRLAAFHVDDQADSAVFVFVPWIIETLCLGWIVSEFHICL